MICCLLLAACARAQDMQNTRGQRFRSESALVLINASVFDRNGRPITDLPADSFQISDEKKQVVVRQFHMEEGPMSTVILLDVSRSMKPGIAHARDALRRFLAAAVEGDEYCLITFSDGVDAGCEFSRDADQVLRNALDQTPSGETAFYDALIAAIAKAKSGSNSRRAVLILSDGRDTASRFGWKAAREHARESTACLYALAPPPQDEDDFIDEQRLKELVETSGGRIFEVRRSADYPSVMDALDIRRQYMIGYSLPPAGLDGRWRRVSVKLKPAQNRELRVFWRRGYYASPQGISQ